MKICAWKLVAGLSFIAALTSCKQNSSSGDSSSNNSGNTANNNAANNGASANTTQQQSTSSLSTTTKCDVNSGGMTMCFEYTNLVQAGFSVAKSSCDEEKGVFTANAACSRTGNVGGCTQGGSQAGQSSSRLVAYQYSPNTVVSVKQNCQAQGEQYVQP